MSPSVSALTSARRFVLAFSAAALLLLAAGAAAAHAAQTVAPSGQYQVWNFNTHGMDTGTGPPPNGSTDPRTDYHLFVNYITDPAHVAYYPDVVTLQEAGTQVDTDPPIHNASCHQFEYALEARTNLDYWCYETTERGGAAVVYRTGRLSVEGTPTKKQMLARADSNSPCMPSGWYAEPVRLVDDANGKHINVAAVHLATSGNDCAWDNTQSITTRLSSDTSVGGLGSNSVQIMAGDWNHTDATATNNNSTFSSWYCWYLGAHTDGTNCQGVNLGWKDAMFRQCMAVVTTDADRYSCLHIYHWSFGSSVHDRRDFLFAKTYAITNQVTVDNYPYFPFSDHRAQGALLQPY